VLLAPFISAVGAAAAVAVGDAGAFFLACGGTGAAALRRFFFGYHSPTVDPLGSLD
jgi:hypothetical protein